MLRGVLLQCSVEAVRKLDRESCLAVNFEANRVSQWLLKNSLALYFNDEFLFKCWHNQYWFSQMFQRWLKRLRSALMCCSTHSLVYAKSTRCMRCGVLSVHAFRVLSAFKKNKHFLIFSIPWVKFRVRCPCSLSCRFNSFLIMLPCPKLFLNTFCRNVSCWI